MSATAYAEADMSSLNSELLEGGVSTRTRSSSKATWLALAAVGIVAACALGVAVSAHTRSVTVKSDSADLQVAQASTAQVAAHANNVAQANFKSQFASMMLMNTPPCRNSHAGYIACLDLVHAAKNLIEDLVDPDVGNDDIMRKIEASEYNVGTAFAFATRDDTHIAAMSPVLARALEDPKNHLTVNGVADLGRCDYVWKGVACLTTLDTGILDSRCEANEKCAYPNKVMPIIHILDDSVAVDKDGKARRRDYGSVGGVGSGTYMSNGYEMNSNGYLANPTPQAQQAANNAGALTFAEAAAMGLPPGPR